VFEFNSGNYGRKLYLIENCVYGVDIQPIAIQISKLRFFISLIVDQKTGGTIDNNYNVLPLPNLETKFVAANTLIGIKRNQDGLADPRIEETQKELLEIRHRHFRPRTVKEKDRLREKDIKLTGELLDLLKEDGFYNSADAAQMAKWNPYNQTEPSGFFDPWWMFGIKDGFDVVIGNPPYISALEFKKIYTENTRKVFNEEYISAAGAYDYFVLFIEKGISLCNDKGYLCFITPNKYLSASYAKKLREYILLNSSIKTVVDVSGINVFENAAIYPVITLFSKQQSHEKYLTAMLIEKTDVFHFDISNYKKYSIPREYLNLLPENIWGFLLSKNVHMLEKLINGATPLASIAGINATSTAGEADEFSICISNKETKNSKKIINTGTIDPYVSLWGKERMTNKGEKFLTPYLDIKKAKVSQRRINMYNSEKIIFAKMAKRVEAFLDIAGEYSSINTNCLYAPKDVSFKYLIAVINSKTFMFLYDLLFGALKMSGGYYQFQAPQLRIMPILIDKNNQTIFDGLVDKILTAKAADPKADTTALERQINNLVYRLYNLTYEEVKVIEPDFPLGKAEYEGME
jgi:hypothetical protein